MENKVILSVCMITYNQEKYIKQAIESVLNQEINFKIEFIIANDSSTDKTDEIICEIIEQHPKGHLITYFKQRNNLGMMPNFAFALQQCQGDFIALCEGDDYWTDSLKLQKQVDFLNKHLNIDLCFTRANIEIEGKELYPHHIPVLFEKKAFEYKELLRHSNFITTASVVFRAPSKFNFLNWFYKVPFGDLALYKIVSNGKPIACLNEFMTVYRIHPEGIYQKQTYYRKKYQHLEFFSLIFDILQPEEQNILKVKKQELILDITKKKFPNNKLARFLFKNYFYKVFQLSN